MENLLHESYHRLINSLTVKNSRFLYQDFNLQNRLTGIIGPRGVGKTTLLLQYIKEHLYDSNKAFYFTADHIYFNQTTLLEFVTNLYNLHGIQYIFIDEVHKYNNWSQELKNLYDMFPTIYIVFSGSSSLELTKGSHDLSRRVKLYKLPGLSFREYLYLSGGAHHSSINLKTLLSSPATYNAAFSTTPKLLGLFNDYLRNGYYPFVFEDKSSYYEKIIQIIEKTIYEDVAEYYSIRTENLHIFKKIMGFLGTIPPGEINVHNIARHLAIDYKTAFHYLTALENTGLARMLHSKPLKGNDVLKKPEKIFLHNTSLLCALNSMSGIEPDMGNLRELFILQSITDANYTGYHSQQGDIVLENRILEIGGKNKTKAQLKDVTGGLLVKDGITAATKDIIPLHYFGFLY